MNPTCHDVGSRWTKKVCLSLKGFQGKRGFKTNSTNKNQTKKKQNQTQNKKKGGETKTFSDLHLWFNFFPKFGGNPVLSSTTEAYALSSMVGANSTRAWRGVHPRFHRPHHVSPVVFWGTLGIGWGKKPRKKSPICNEKRTLTMRFFGIFRDEILPSYVGMK